MAGFMRKMPSLTFRPPPGDFPAIRPGDVHIWCARLDLNHMIIQELRSLLSEVELERAGAFHFEHDRDRFIVAHGQLRLMLGRYLHMDPERLIFHNSDFGKPALHPPRLEFNITHAGNLAVFVFSPGRKVGVDIEKIHPVPEAESIIARLFSSREMKAFSCTSPADRDRGFLEFWTRGEAFVKAIGQGFGEYVGAISLDRIEASDKYWEIRSFSPDPDYIGAVTMDGSPHRLFCWHWPE
jgi:4'-phosphopantetheinyl transferase